MVKSLVSYGESCVFKRLSGIGQIMVPKEIMKRNALFIVLLLALLFIGLPWLVAYHSYAAASGYLGTEEGKQIRFVYVDKTHFEAYKTALWFDESLSITGQDGAIYCNGNQIGFPSGKNVALVNGSEDMIFVELGGKYFREDTGQSEVGYVLGKVPHFKEKAKGIIELQKVKEDQVIKEEWTTFLGISALTGTGQPSASADADNPRR